MNLVPVNTASIIVGQPLPCALLDQNGVLLANEGFMVGSRKELEVMVGKRNQIYIDADQTDSLRREYVNRLNNLVLEDRSLGQIADVQVSLYDAKRNKSTDVESDEADWLYLQNQAHALLRDNQGDTFLPRLERLQNELERETLRNPDAALFALIHLSGSEIRQYSATHAMLVSVICSLAARDVLRWPPAHLKALSSAALTMNISMTELQDQLASQKEPCAAFGRPAPTNGCVRCAVAGGRAQPQRQITWTAGTAQRRSAPGAPDPARRHVCRPHVAAHHTGTRGARCGHAVVLF